MPEDSETVPDKRRPLPRAMPGVVLHRLYRNGWTLEGLVDVYDASYRRIRELLQAEGCVFRPPMRRMVDATRGMIKAYQVGFLSIRQVSRLWGLSYNQTRAALLRAGVQLRPRGNAPRWQPSALIVRYGAIAARERVKLGWRYTQAKAPATQPG